MSSPRLTDPSGWFHLSRTGLGVAVAVGFVVLAVNKLVIGDEHSVLVTPWLLGFLGSAFLMRIGHAIWARSHPEADDLGPPID